MNLPGPFGQSHIPKGSLITLPLVNFTYIPPRYIFDSPTSPCQRLLRRYAETSSLVHSSLVTVVALQVCVPEHGISATSERFRLLALDHLTDAISKLESEPALVKSPSSKLGTTIEQALLGVIMIGFSSVSLERSGMTYLSCQNSHINCLRSPGLTSLIWGYIT